MCAVDVRFFLRKIQLQALVQIDKSRVVERGGDLCGSQGLYACIEHIFFSACFRHVLDALGQPLHLGGNIGLALPGHALEVARQKHKAVLQLVDVRLVRIKAGLLFGKFAKSLGEMGDGVFKSVGQRIGKRVREIGGQRLGYSRQGYRRGGGSDFYGARKFAAQKVLNLGGDASFGVKFADALEDADGFFWVACHSAQAAAGKVVLEQGGITARGGRGNTGAFGDVA